MLLITIFVDRFYELEEKLFENEHDNYKICNKDKNGNLNELSKNLIRELFESFKEPLLVGALEKNRYKIKIQNYDVYLIITNKSILVNNREFSNLYLCNDSNSVCQKLSTLINKEQNFTIIFDNSSYIYTNRELFLNLRTLALNLTSPFASISISLSASIKVSKKVLTLK